VIGEGMPIFNTNQKGNLYIKFNIIFPRALAEIKKAELRKLLA
jgi:DnaJ-class molecular chaperone